MISNAHEELLGQPGVTGEHHAEGRAGVEVGGGEDAQLGEDRAGDLLGLATTLVPYLRSVFLFQPDVQRVVELPLVARLHAIGAFALFAAFSFTRLVHALVTLSPTCGGRSRW